MHQLTVPAHIRHWRRNRDDESLTLGQLLSDPVGRKLVEMRLTRMNALRPLRWVAAVWLLTIVCSWPMTTSIFTLLARTLVHPAMLLFFAALIAITKFSQWHVLCIRRNIHIWSLSFLGVLSDLCRTSPALTREHYTRTMKMRKRHFKQTVPRYIKVQKLPRPKCDPKTKISKSQQRISGIVARLKADAERSRRQRATGQNNQSWLKTLAD